MPGQSCGHLWVSCFAFSPPSLQAPVGAQPLGVSDFPCTVWPFPQGCLPALLPSSPQLSLVPLIYVILVLPFILEAALCPARVLLFPFQCTVSRGASGLLLQKGRATIPLPGSPTSIPWSATALWMLVTALTWVSLMSVNYIKLCEKKFCLRKKTEMDLRKKAHARHQRKKIPFWCISLRVFSLGDHLGGDAAARDKGAWSCSSLVQIQSEHVTRASEGKIWKCQHLPEPKFCGFSICSLPKALFQPDLFLWQWKEQLCEKGCVPNTFQVCAKITREQNSSNKHYLEFLYRCT